MNIGELVVHLGVKADTFTVKDFTRAMADMPFAVAGAITSLAGVSFGFLELTKNTLDLSNQLGIFRSETGLSIEELQKWDAVAKQVGVSTDVVHSSIMGIAQALAAINTGHPDLAFMQAMGQLHVSPYGKTPYQTLNDIMGATRGMNPAVASDLLNRAHVSPEMMRIFSLSPREFGRMAAVGPTMTESDQRAMQSFQETIARLGITIEREFVRPLVTLRPVLEQFTDILASFIKVAAPVAVSGATSIVGEMSNIRHKRVMESLAWLPEHSALGLLGSSLAGKIMNYQTTQNIYSTSDPQEVARLAHQHLSNETQKANKHFNNGGY